MECIERMEVWKYIQKVDNLLFLNNMINNTNNYIL